MPLQIYAICHKRVMLRAGSHRKSTRLSLIVQILGPAHARKPHLNAESLRLRYNKHGWQFLVLNRSSAGATEHENANPCPTVSNSDLSCRIASVGINWLRVTTLPGALLPQLGQKRELRGQCLLRGVVSETPRALPRAPLTRPPTRRVTPGASRPARWFGPDSLCSGASHLSRSTALSGSSPAAGVGRFGRTERHYGS